MRQDVKNLSEIIENNRFSVNKETKFESIEGQQRWYWTKLILLFDQVTEDVGWRNSMVGCLYGYWEGSWQSLLKAVRKVKAWVIKMFAWIKQWCKVRKQSCGILPCLRPDDQQWYHPPACGFIFIITWIQMLNKISKFALWPTNLEA